MKFLSAITVVFFVLASFLTVDAQAAKPTAKPLPTNVQNAITDALSKITDFTDSDAVKAAVLGVIANYKSFAPEIVAFATQFVGAKLANNPTAAANVIPAFVKQAAADQPELAPAIVGLAVDAVPANLKVAVVPNIVSDALANVTDKKAKAEILNAALEATEGNKVVTDLLDAVAKTNNIKIVDNNDPNAPRYIVDDLTDFNSGDQGVGTLGTLGGASGGGGNPGNAANSPTPAS